MAKQFVCIMCPIGCNLTVEQKNGEVIVSGNTCIRGEAYGKQEIIEPTRIVTSLAVMANGIVSVKTSLPVPKDKIFEVLKIIKNLKPKAVKQGDILVKNVLGTGSNIVVTSNL